MKTVSLFIFSILITFSSYGQPKKVPQAKLTARVFNSGFPQAHDSYNGISCASDGKIYYILCTQSLDVAGRMYSYDPTAGKIKLLGDLTEVCGEKDLHAVAQGKSHVNFIESKKKLYFATHVGYYENDRRSSFHRQPSCRF